MKRLFALSLLLLLNTTLQAQEEKKSKVGLLIFGGIGYGKIMNESEPNYNLNSNTGEILVNYRFSKIVGIASGINYTVLNGNGFNSNGNFYHERGMIKFPLLATFSVPMAEHMKMFLSIGPYASKITSDEYQFLYGTEKDVFDSWNFGSQMNVGFSYQLNKEWGIGMNFSGQSDFAEIESNNNAVVNGKQKTKSLTNLGLFFTVDF
ncbi:hypothetical protein FEDK69T_04140 [Flavobacterium enshiense DK69]|uniref:outer membrane beta-barrel protein n=1 Tax=Flavobacterium enshiense TaxID=1341165 RepID=UPI0003C5AB51|nr:outer membrane beta-barrel protein [Flavobacterium enshiense]ESU24861.1 hypothetical protein FEDK69T_04140 [Flavobacterium enshiense DK69]